MKGAEIDSDQSSAHRSLARALTRLNLWDHRPRVEWIVSIEYLYQSVVPESFATREMMLLLWLRAIATGRSCTYMHVHERGHLWDM